MGASTADLGAEQLTGLWIVGLSLNPWL